MKPYGEVIKFFRKSNEAREMTALPDSSVMKSFRRYVPGLEKEYDPAMGITSPEWQCYDLETAGGRRRVRSMLTLYELGLLYAVGRNHYRGDGEIIDGGPLLGVGTWALARGLSHNPHVSNKRKRIWSFDLWLAENMGATVEGCGLETGSVFETFLETVRDYLDEISCSPGDLLRLRWQGGPVEVLFVDLAKSWDLNLWVLRQWFTALIPGQSIVIQQDYVWFDAWWIAVTMEYFRDCFERLGFVFGASAVYRCINKIGPERIEAFSHLTFEDMRAFMHQAIYSAPESVAQVLRCGMARLLMERDRDAAVQALAGVKLDVSVSDPSEDFSIIAKSNYEIMTSWLK